MTPLEEQRNRRWNAGYSDGYHGRPSREDREPYLTAYTVGVSDRIEDEEALASGDLDGLSESEREFLYGEEEKASGYRRPADVPERDN